LATNKYKNLHLNYTLSKKTHIPSTKEMQIYMKNFKYFKLQK
jgi:hypothetical protein